MCIQIGCVCKSCLQFSSVVDIKRLTVEQVFWSCGFIWKAATGNVHCTAMYSNVQKCTPMHYHWQGSDQLNLNNVAGTSVPCSAHSHWHLVARFENLSRKH